MVFYTAKFSKKKAVAALLLLLGFVADHTWKMRLP